MTGSARKDLAQRLQRTPLSDPPPNVGPELCHCLFHRSSVHPIGLRHPEKCKESRFATHTSGSFGTDATGPIAPCRCPIPVPENSSGGLRPYCMKVLEALRGATKLRPAARSRRPCRLLLEVGLSSTFCPRCLKRIVHRPRGSPIACRQASRGAIECFSMVRKSDASRWFHRPYSGTGHRSSTPTRMVCSEPLSDL